MTEEELLDRIKKEPAEFRILFDQYYKSIFGYIFRRTADFDLAKDIVSETFRKAFLNIQHFSYRGISIKVWLYRIATNEANLYFRYKKFVNRYVENYGFIHEQEFIQYIEDDRKDIELELIKHEQFKLIVEQLKTMPVKYQEVIALRFFETKSNREISDILNMNEGTVKSLISRGLEKLRGKCNEN